MLRIILTLVLTTAISTAQMQTPAARPQASSAAASAQTSPSQATTVASNDAVISIKGFCGVDADPKDPASVHTSECLTVITREQFEKLMDALNPTHQTIAPETQRKLAESYVDLMLFAAKARQEGIDKSPSFETVMNLMRIRALADLYRRDLEQSVRNPTAEEIEAYYRQNQASYQEMKVRKISIPRNSAPGDDQEAYTKKATRVAQDIRDRVVKGEDVADLQKEAYATLALSNSPPVPMQITLRQGMLPADVRPDVMALGVGGVSKVELETNSYVIYKLEAKEALPLEQVKGDVIARLAQQKMDAKSKEIGAAARVSFNEQYFAPTKGLVLENLH